MLFMRLPFAWVKGSNRVPKAIQCTPISTVCFSARMFRTPARIESDSSMRCTGQSTLAGSHSRFNMSKPGIDEQRRVVARPCRGFCATAHINIALCVRRYRVT